MRKLHLVEIEWEDTTSKHDWADEKGADIQTAIIHSVGWRLRSNRKYLLLATQRDFTYGECSDRIKIPRGCVKSIRRIE